ncbi:MAG: hypothetical protein NZ898_14615 [Myxococcota bacterium]|nr:hypothetical protein [Myxococcota bacterium]MDW8363873.1 hypothetical protein [Myxococcales bacterium]
MRRTMAWGIALVLGSCAKQQAPINQVGVNVVDKALFTGSWYVNRTVIDVDYEAAGIGTYPGDSAIDIGDDSFTAIPRIRWVIDQNYLYAFRDYERIEGYDGEPRTPGAEGFLGTPVAAFRIQSHFDIRRAYNPVTGEEQNVIVENTTDRRWYERRFMRVDWSNNLLPGYYGQIHELYEVLGYFRREPAELYVQDRSDWPDSWQPQFHFMSCDGPSDENCDPHDRDWAADYPRGQLYHMSFVTQELLSPGMVPDPFTGEPVNWCVSVYADAPVCTTVSVFVRTSFLRVSDRRQYEPVNWVDSRFDRHGYFRLERATFDRSTAADDPAFGATDFLNYNVNRHNIWMQYRTADGRPIHPRDRQVRRIVWYTTPELPAHLVRPSFALVGAWNWALMSSVRHARGQRDAVYPRVDCQRTDPEAYCYCITDPESGEVLNPTCPGMYDPFESPDQARARGATDPYDCWVEVPAGAEPDLNKPDLTDRDFFGWFGARTRGSECVTELRINTCNRRSIADNGGTMEGLRCEERGDARFKFLSYVDQPGTAFLGVATLRSDPVTGEILFGDANIGGPALDSYRTSALQQYDLINGDLTELELYTGEDVRSYLESLNTTQYPAPPRIDFTVALREGTADPRALGDLQSRMDRFMERAERLRGPEGLANTFSSRLTRLRGSPIERRLMENWETLLMAGIEHVPPGRGPSDINDAILDRVSPFRVSAHDLLAEYEALERKVGRHGVHLPNEYIDDSVRAFVQRHRDWPRARLEFALNRALYFETQLHEMGHCLGLRHDFGASADTGNYYDDYYLIDARAPWPSPSRFDRDGVPGLNPDEQRAYEQAFVRTRERRELAGIDQWMNSSVMEYTANWYERVVGRPGRYDFAAIHFGYNDLVEAYDNEAGLRPEQITPVNTPRVMFRYYHGGETCRADDDCPYSASGARADLLLETNRSAGLVQRCETFTDDGGVSRQMCSNFDRDLAAHAAGGGRYAPVRYRFCTDERAAGGSTAVGSIGWCNRFDEGDSYRDIVRNVAESYDRMYLWTNFRRYRREFDIGNYLFNTLIGRRLVILQNVYQNMLYEYHRRDPDYVNSTGPFGFADQFLATADILNFYVRVLGWPDVGAYNWNEQWRRYQRVSADPRLAGANLSIPIGMGRYVSSMYQAGLSGISRVERIGTFYDKWFVMQLMTRRGFGARYTPDVPFYTNMYDLFPLEMQQLFSGIIQDRPEEYMPRVVCGGRFPACTSPRLVFMDFYRGNCFDPDSRTCRPDPVDVTYRDLLVLDAGGSFLLQYFGTIYALSEFPVFFDTTFQNQLFVCVVGQGDCHVPGPTAVEGVDYVRYSSRRYGKDFIAWQVEPTGAVTNQTSIGFAMVAEARDTAFIIEMLQKYRGDFGGTPYSMSNLSAEERARLAAIGYTVPRDAGAVTSEEDRLDGRLRDLESFFNQLIELERELGIDSYLRY